MRLFQREIKVTIRFRNKQEENISEFHITKHALIRFMERAGISDPQEALTQLKVLLSRVVCCFQKGEKVLYQSETDHWKIVAKRSYKKNYHCVVTLYPSKEPTCRPIQHLKK